MIYGKEKLFEAFTDSEWKFDETTGEVVRYNRKGNRKLAYNELGDRGGGVFATLGLYFKNEKGEWSEVFSMKHLLTDLGEERISFILTTHGNEEQLGFDGMIFYDSKKRWDLMGDVKPDPSFSDQVAADREELLYQLNELPEELDHELTASLFVKQMIEGEMERPVLVPEGLFRYVEPEELAPGTMATYANLTVAGRLMAEAKTKEESRVATSIFSLVIDRDIMRFPM